MVSKPLEQVLGGGKTCELHPARKFSCGDVAAAGLRPDMHGGNEGLQRKLPVGKHRLRGDAEPTSATLALPTQFARRPAVDVVGPTVRTNDPLAASPPCLGEMSNAAKIRPLGEVGLRRWYAHDSCSPQPTAFLCWMSPTFAARSTACDSSALSVERAFHFPTRPGVRRRDFVQGPKMSKCAPTTSQSPAPRA